MRTEGYLGTSVVALLTACLGEQKTNACACCAGPMVRTTLLLVVSSRQHNKTNDVFVRRHRRPSDLPFIFSFSRTAIRRRPRTAGRGFSSAAAPPTSRNPRGTASYTRGGIASSSSPGAQAGWSGRVTRCWRTFWTRRKQTRRGGRGNG